MFTIVQILIVRLLSAVAAFHFKHLTRAVRPKLRLRPGSNGLWRRCKAGPKTSALGLFILLAALVVGNMAEAGDLTGPSEDLDRLLRDPQSANDPSVSSDLQLKVSKEAKAGFELLMLPALADIARIAGQKANVTFQRQHLASPNPGLQAELVLVDGQWAWDFFSTLESIEEEMNILSWLRGDAAFKFWAQAGVNPPPSWTEDELTRYRAGPGAEVVAVGNSDRAILEWYEDEDSSQYGSVTWMRGTDIVHLVQVQAIAPDGQDRKAFALAIAETVNAALEKHRFFAFPNEYWPEQAVSADITLLDANPKFSKDGKTRAEDRKATDLIGADVDRIGTTADGVSQLIVRAELPDDAPVSFAVNGVEDGTITPLLDGRTVALQDRHYAFALYTPPDRFDPQPDVENSPNNPLVPPEKRLGDILEIRDVAITVAVGESGHEEKSLTLARPPVVLVHGLFSDPIQTWIRTFDDGASMAALLERAGFLPFMVNYQDTNGNEGTDEGFLGVAVIGDSSFQGNRSVVWDSPLVDYTPVKYEYGFFEEEPIQSELQKPAAARIGGISQALTYYRNELNLAATQAIVVGHSMGGILARVWASETYNPEYRRPENFMQGDINRLLTLNTPHHGSELIELKDALSKAQIDGEEWLAWGRRQITNTALWWLLEPERGAVSDLRPGSRALRRIGATPVPSFALTTTFSAAQTGEKSAPKNDPLRIYEALYAAAGTVFFSNRPLLDEFVTSRFIRWRNTAEGFQESGDWRGQDKLNQTDAENLQRFREIVARNIDSNVYYWAARRETDYQDELRATLRSAIIAPYGVFATSMGNDDELDMLSARFLFSNALTGVDVSRFFDDAKVSDVPETFLTILRDLVFHNDPKTDGAVREVSQVGGLSAHENIEDVVHSYSPWDYRVQRRVLFLLKSEHAAFDPAGFPEAGQLTPRYMPSRQLSDPQVMGDEAIAWSGMVPSHAQEYLNVADENDVFILVRPVNPSSTGLLANNAAAKGMNVKGKSSNWGPQVGYIPFDQRYSKLWRVVRDPDRRKLQIEDYNKKTEESTTDSHPVMTDRKYAVQRALTDIQTANGACDVVTDPKGEDAEDAVFFHCSDTFFRWQNGMRNDLAIFDPSIPLISANLNADQKKRALAHPMMVLADDTSDLTPRPYLTADYDLLAIGFRFDGDLCVSGQIPDPGETVDCTPGPTSGVRTATFDPLRGYISPRQQDIVAVMNGYVNDNTGYTGGLVTHHGPENQYGKSPYVDYPILVFDPADPTDDTDGITYLVRQGPPGFRDIHLKRLFTEKNRLGYNLWPNPTSRAWRWNERQPFDLARGYDPRDVADLPPYVEEAPRPDHPNAAPVPNEAADPGLKDVEIAAKDAEPEVTDDAPKPEPEAKEPLGIEPEKDYDFEVTMYFNLANSGNAQAQYKLATMYEIGDRVPYDFEMAARLYRYAADQGLAEAQDRLAFLYEVGQGVPKDNEMARNLYRQAADQGYAEAQVTLGLNFYEGWGVDQNREAGVKLLALAAAQGNATALYYLGESYELGLGAPQDLSAALRNYTRSAELGDDMAQYRLGQIYQLGKAVPKDLRKAQNYYEQAAEQGNNQAQFNLAELYEELERIASGKTSEGSPLTDLAIETYTKAASQGHAEAQYTLGRRYDYARGVTRDYALAGEWYLRAAEQGHAKAQNDLGLLYELGQGVDVDYEQAIYWYRSSADQGYARGQYNLATMYDYGRGVETDDKTASEWYRRAADQDHAGAQNNLGLLYELGDGVPRDHETAVHWYHLSAEQGHKRGQYNLATMYDFGRGIEQDYEAAAKWYLLAAEQGYRTAQSNLGVLYANGRGVEKDIGEAAKWYRLAADQGHAKSQDLLGVLYAGGWGVSQDYMMATQLFRLAAEQGNASGHYHLGQAYLHGKGVAQNDTQALAHWNIAASLGDSNAILARIGLKSKLGGDEIDRAQRFVREWLAEHGD